MIRAGHENELRIAPKSYFARRATDLDLFVETGSRLKQIYRSVRAGGDGDKSGGRNIEGRRFIVELEAAENFERNRIDLNNLTARARSG